MRLLAAATRPLAQVDDDVLTPYQLRENRVCSATGDSRDGEGNPICRQIFEWTESAFLAENFDALLTATFRALFIILLAWVAIRLLRRAIDRFVRGLKERSLEKLETLRRKGSATDTAPITLARTQQRTETIGGVLRSAATIIVITVAMLMLLGTFGFNLGPLIAGAGIAGVAIGFGAQSLVKDFLTGIFMLMEDQFGVGDIVDVGEAVGTVDAITLRTTRIRSINGTLWHIPNGEIARVGNMSQLWSRALLDIGVAYETHVPEACRIMKQVADGMAGEEAWTDSFFEPAEVWGVQDLADNEVTIRMVAKVIPAKQWAVERELRARIKHAFDQAGISIPYPQRTVWIHHVDGRNGDGPEGASAPTALPSTGGEAAERGAVTPGGSGGAPAAPDFPEAEGARETGEPRASDATSDLRGDPATRWRGDAAGESRGDRPRSNVGKLT
jgi:moderate conductance mechanosensitive channel